MNTTEFVAENSCNNCDNDCVHTVFNLKDFWDYKVGRIRCKECGEIMLPCNECGGQDADGETLNCNRCPWKNAEIADEMSDIDYLKWIKENEPENWVQYKDGSCGDYYKELIEKNNL